MIDKAKLVEQLMAYENTLANDEAALIDRTIFALSEPVYDHDVREYLELLDAENAKMREALKTGKAMGLFHSDAESSVTHRDLCKLVDELLEKDNEQA